MTPTFVIVPVRNEWRNLTSLLLGQLLEERVEHVVVLDNGSTDGTAAGLAWLQRNWRRSGGRGPRFTRLDRPGDSIYTMWSDGFRFAKQRAAKLGAERWNALYLNNDVELYRDTAGVLAHHLRINDQHHDQDPSVWCTYPDVDAEWPPPPLTRYHLRETHGVFGDGGLFGPCFMLAGEKIPWTQSPLSLPLVTDPSYRWWWGDNHLAECIEQEGGKQMRVVGLPIKHINEATAQNYPDLYAVKLHDRGKWITRESRGARGIMRR